MVHDLLVEGIEDAGRVLLLSEIISSVDFCAGPSRWRSVCYGPRSVACCLADCRTVWRISAAAPVAEVLSCCLCELGSAVIEWGPPVGALPPP